MKSRNFVAAIAVLAGLFCVTAFASITGPIAHQRTNTPKKADANTGRYLYLGTAPRFEARNLELYVSKMALTLRVKGWVPAQMPANYGYFLLERWNRIAEAFQAGSMSFEELSSPQQLEARTADKGVKAWVKVAAQYSKHILEGQGLDIYQKNLPPQAYKDLILTATLRHLMNDPTLTIEQGFALVQKMRQEKERIAAKTWSEDLFNHHLNAHFTRDDSKGDGSIGFVTYVFPIAATTAGPFSQPKEQVRTIGDEGSIEARWWSDKWQDEFGGFPFLLIEPSGVAFHGPITNQSTLDVWYLRRGYVSHGCHRMDSSDLLEFRSLLPTDFTSLAKRKSGVKIVITEWPDVTDVNNDGRVEAMDVAYYDIPSWIGVPKNASIDQVASQWMVSKAQMSFWKRQFSKYDGMLSSKNRFDAAQGVFYGIPKYSVGASRLKKDGFHEAVPILSLPYEGNRVIQYREAGSRLSGFDDLGGRYAPKYFNVF